MKRSTSPSASPQLFYFSQPAPSLSRSGSTASRSNSSSTRSSDDFYFSEASSIASTSSSAATTPSSTSSPSADRPCNSLCKCTRCTLGDFVFDDNSADYMEYLALIQEYHSSNINAGSSPPSSSASSTPLTSPEFVKGPGSLKAPDPQRPPWDHAVSLPSSIDTISSSASRSTQHNHQIAHHHHPRSPRIDMLSSSVATIIPASRPATRASQRQSSSKSVQHRRERHMRGWSDDDSDASDSGASDSEVDVYSALSSDEELRYVPRRGMRASSRPREKT